eukprot:Tamp_04153.p1 GENE.Tamp_04153~~Tamp_04153.p1  ORF type:complete len:458 (-),score=130.31 Tamp_04153:1985-3358(-)
MLGAPKAAGGPLAPMDPWAAAQWYVVAKALGSVPGMKVMLLDSATAATVGLVCSQSQALERQVYHVDKLGNPRTRRLGGFRALVIVRTTPDSLRDLRQELADPKFDEYHLFFTNTLQDHHLQDIARADLCQVVRQVQELYLDFSPLGPDLFTLDVPSCMPLEPPSWDQPIFDSLCGGLTAVLLALKLNPVIAYQVNSSPANKIAHEVAERIATGNHSSDPDLFRFGNSAAASKQPPLLLILDRRDDPVTALLSQWTYSAMVHEIMGIHHNRVTVTKGGGKEDEQGEQVVLSEADDDFYRSSQHLVFGELGSALKSIVDEFQRSEAGAVSMAGGKSRLTSISDIERFMHKYPEFKKQQGMVAKHVAVTSRLSAVVEERNLLDLSELEQELACEESLTDSFNRVETLLADSKVPLLPCACPPLSLPLSSLPLVCAKGTGQEALTRQEEMTRHAKTPTAP